MHNNLERITIDSTICHGKPTIRGLRYPVENILELMASGMTIEELLEDYSDLEREEFLACLSYASKLASSKRFDYWLIEKAFTKNNSGRDTMIDEPSPLDEKLFKELGGLC